MTLDSSFYLAGGLFLVGMLYLTFCINEYINITFMMLRIKIK